MLKLDIQKFAEKEDDPNLNIVGTGTSNTVANPALLASIESNVGTETETEEVTGDTPFDVYLKNLGLGEAAVSAGTRSLSRILEENQMRQESAAQSYSDMYQQARDLATRRGGLSNVSGFTGGMAQQQADRLSAAEMAQLTTLGVQRESTLRGIEAEKQTAWSDALLEAQQTQDIVTAQQDRTLAIESQVMDVQTQLAAFADIADEDLTDAQRAQKASLEAYLERLYGMGGTRPAETTKTVSDDVTAEEIAELKSEILSDKSATFTAEKLTELVNKGVLTAYEASQVAQRNSSWR